MPYDPIVLMDEARGIAGRQDLSYQEHPEWINKIFIQKEFVMAAMARPVAPVSQLCSICQEGTQAGELCELHHVRWIRDDGVAMEVPHFFHAECISSWLGKGATTCPNCRNPLTAREIGRFLSPHPATGGGNTAVLAPDAAGAMLNVAASAGNLYTVQDLLANNGPISEDYRGLALCNAAEAGHLSVLQALLAGGAISETYRGWAVGAAASANHLPEVEALLASGPISEDRRGMAVVTAARAGHLSVVRVLLASGPISEDKRNRAIHSAIEHGHQDIASALQP